MLKDNVSPKARVSNVCHLQWPRTSDSSNQNCVRYHVRQQATAHWLEPEALDAAIKIFQTFAYLFFVLLLGYCLLKYSVSPPHALLVVT